MAAPARRRLLALIALTILCTAGCNPVTSLYFMAMGFDPKIEPECKLSSDDKKKDVRVLVLTYSALETRPELLAADRELSVLVSQKLTEAFKENKEKVTILSPAKVQRYKDEHPNWQALGPDEIGKCFHADYVINLELSSLTLFDAHCYNQMLRGTAEISVTVHDMSKPGEEPIFKTEYSTEYPKGRQVPVSDTSPQKFRLQFLTRVATDLSWYFTAHPVADSFPCD